MLHTQLSRLGCAAGGRSPLFPAVPDTARLTPSSTWASKEKWKSLDVCYLPPPPLGTAALASGTSSTVGDLEKENAV